MVRGDLGSSDQPGITGQLGITGRDSMGQSGVSGSGTSSSVGSPLIRRPPFPAQVVPSTQRPTGRVGEPASTIEAAFDGLTLQPLWQFGYTLFSAPPSAFVAADNIPVGPDYVLGPGDDLVVNTWGLVEDSLVRTVDRNGEIILPKVGALRVWGMTFAQADRLVRDQLSRYYRGFKTGLTLGRLRTIRVYAVGEVCQPGTYIISGLSTLTNALFAAGGLTKLGSLRQIQLMRNGHTVGTLDLYDFLLRGDRTHDYRLDSGDTIFVPPIGPVAAVAGEVKRPGIYELKESDRLGDLIQMAGGPTPRSYLKRVQVNRLEPNSERVVVDLDLTALYIRDDPASNIELRNGDLAEIFPSEPRIYKAVTLVGAVKHPGKYELKPAMRVGDLLSREELLPDSHLERVEIARLKEDFTTTEISPVNLKQLVDGDQDQISVHSAFKTPRKVILAGEIKRPGIYTFALGERLSSVLKRAGGFTDKAYLKGAVYTKESSKRVEQERLEEFVRNQEQRLLAEAGSVVVTGADQEEVSIAQQTLALRRELLMTLANKVVLGRVVIKLDELERFEGSPSDVLLDDGDSLFIPTTPSAVVVMGSVRNPTSVLYKKGAPLEYYLERAGGLSKEADRKEVHVVKADGSALTGFVQLRKLEPGDAVVVPPRTEVKYRPVSIARDLITIVGQSLLTIAALGLIF